MSKPDTRILITGGTGCLGKRLFADQLKRGKSVIVTARNIAREESQKEKIIHYIVLDWLRTAPEEVAAWCSQHPATLSEILAQWEASELKQHTEWANANPEAAIIRLVETINKVPEMTSDFLFKNRMVNSLLKSLEADFSHRLKWINVDFTQYITPEKWQDILSRQGYTIDQVVNAVGIHWETETVKFEDVNYKAPCALFEAIARVNQAEGKNIRLINVSSLAYELEAPAELERHYCYWESRQRSDDYLLDDLAGQVDGFVFVCDFIYDGTGQDPRFKLLETMASIGLAPRTNEQARFRPIAVTDFLHIMNNLLDREDILPPGREFRWLPMCGPQELTIEDMINEMRLAINLPPAKHIPVGDILRKIASRLTAYHPNDKLNPATATLFLGFKKLKDYPPDKVAAIANIDSRNMLTIREVYHKSPINNYIMEQATMTASSMAEWLFPVRPQQLVDAQTQYVSMLNAMDFIKNYPPFSYLSDTELDALRDMIELNHYPPDTYVLRQDGPPSQHLYIIYSGSVHLMNGDRIVQVFESGEMFALLSVVNHEPPVFDVVTEEATYVYAISALVIRQTLEQNSKFANFFLKGFRERLRHHVMTLETPSTFSSNLTVNLATLVNRAPTFVTPQATVQEAAKIMGERRTGYAIIEADPPGIITERDFKNRVLAQGLGPETLVTQIMSRPLKMLPAETPVYRALLTMLDENIHHVPLIQQGKIMGVIGVTDVLRHQTMNPFYLFRQLETPEYRTVLEQYDLELIKIVETMFNSGLDVVQIGRVVASLNDALTKQLLKQAEDELGPPPTPYAWLVFGSEGRMEQIILTDQDNALVYQDDTPEAAAYFSQLTERVVRELIQAGFPPCPGGYMATEWCKPLSHWEQLFQQWIRTSTAQILFGTAIFFDFRAVHGQLSLKPLYDLLQQARNQKSFLAHLARVAGEFRPPLGFFKRVSTDEHGMVNLKLGGIAPIVGIARVYGLQAGIRSASTLDRFEAAVKANLVTTESAETLIEMFRFLLRTRLKDQLATCRRGERPDNKISWEAMMPLNRNHLKEAFGIISEHQDYLIQHFHTDILN